MLQIHTSHYNGQPETDRIFYAPDMKTAKDKLYACLMTFLITQKHQWALDPEYWQARANHARFLLEAMQPTKNTRNPRLLHPTISRNIYTRAANLYGEIELFGYCVEKITPYLFVVSLSQTFYYNTVSFYITKEASQPPPTWESEQEALNDFLWEYIPDEL